MNKPTINGIDVSECNIRFNHFGKNICELGNRKLGELHYLCSENPNCYFKEFKRLQEENKELKKLKCKFKEYCTCDIEKYRSALEEIRKYCEEQNLKADYTACEILTIIDEVLYEN